MKQIFLWQWVWIKIISCTNKAEDYSSALKGWKNDINTIQRNVDARAAAGGRAEEILRTCGDRWSIGMSNRPRILY